MKKLLLLLLIFPSISYSKDYIPLQAFAFKPIIEQEINTYFPNIPEFNYVPSLIEHESCQYLSHKRCWSSTSSLKTKREEGAGLSQITRAYREDGSIRFDSLKGIRDAYKNELKELSWSNVYQKPELQIRAMILMVRDDYKKLYSIPDQMNRLQFTDSAYNGGLRDVQRSRRACGLASNCNPDIWFSNVEKHIAKSPRILYGDRSAIDINSHHVTDVFLNNIPKYKKEYFIHSLTNVKKDI